MAPVNGSGMPAVLPPSVDIFHCRPPGNRSRRRNRRHLGLYLPVASDLYYPGGYLGTLKIPAIGLSVRVYEDTDSSTPLRRARDISKAPASGWKLRHPITWTTKLGARTYRVTSVQKVKETDTSGTAPFHREHAHSLHLCA